MDTKAKYIRKWARLLEDELDEDNIVEKEMSDIYQLSEGIEINRRRSIISFTDSHEDNVDTSLDGNPTVDTETIPNVSIWSIFKRKRGASKKLDGNPLVYALKNENGWKFNSEEDKNAIIRQFQAIADKFLKTHSFDVTMIVPSSSPLNNYIADVILSKDPSIEKIEGRIVKMSTEDIYAAVMRPNSLFRKVFTTDKSFNDALDLLEKYLDDMDNEKDGRFTRHYVANSKIRNAIDKTLKLTPSSVMEDASKINDHDVLIIDDVVSRGQTIKDMIETLKSAYAPKSITVLTLLSKLY